MNMEKLSAHSIEQVPMPSTSSGINPFFNPQIMNTSQPDALQAMTNSIFSANPFLNQNGFPLTALGTGIPDFRQMQQWFQQCSPYTSPLASNAPSIANLSGLSLFTNDSTITLNSQIGLKPKKDKEYDQGELTQTIITLLKDDEIMHECMRVLRMYVNLIIERKFTIDQKYFSELIKLMVEKLLAPKNQRIIGPLLEIIVTISSLSHYSHFVREQSRLVSQTFINLFVNAHSYTLNSHQVVCLLRIIYNTVSYLRDKGLLRTQKFFQTLLNYLKVTNTNVQFFTLGIIRILLHRQEQWKNYFLEEKGMELILHSLRLQNNRKFIKQAIRTLVTIIDSTDSKFATRFVQNRGISIIISKMNVATGCSLDEISLAFQCLILVSDIPELTRVPAEEIANAIHFALKCTFPIKITKNELDLYWKNIINVLRFIRNAIIMNEPSRKYLASFDNRKSIPHIVGLTNQTFQLLLTSKQTSSDPPVMELEPPKFSTLTKKQKLLEEIVEQCLAILASINKEDMNGQIEEVQQMASKSLADDDIAMTLYQQILISEFHIFHKSVLMSLTRILNAKVSLRVTTDNGNFQIAETLMKFLFITNLNANRWPLMKQAAELLTRLIFDNRQHLSVITVLFRNDVYQPFKLLQSVMTNTDLFLSILKLIKDLCQSESTLKALWFNDTNINFLKYLEKVTDNQEIANLCTKIFDGHQMQIGEDTSESAFYEIFAQGMELDQSGPT